MLSLALCLLCLPRQESPAPEPVFAQEVLQRHARAGDLVLEASYRRALQTAQIVWAVEGRVRRLADGIERFRIDGKVVVTFSDGTTVETSATLWRRGDEWSFLNRTHGKWCRGTGPGLGGELSAALYGLWALPFARDSERDSFDPDGWTDEGRSRFAGEVCRVIGAKTTSGAEQRWFMSTVDALPLMIRSQRPLDGAETLFETWSRRGLEERRVADRRVAPQDLEADGLEQFDALATSVAEAFGARAPKLHGRVISLAEGLDPFRRLFDAARGRPRVVGLFGPT